MDLITGVNTEVPVSWHWPSTGINMTAQDLSNAIRLAVLWHHGGLYLDMDMILLRNDAKDALTKGMFPMIGQDIDTVNNAVMMFPASQHGFLRQLMEEFEQVTPRAGGHRRWGDHGPRLLQGVLDKWNTENALVYPAQAPADVVGKYNVSAFEPFHYRQIEPMVKEPLEEPIFWKYLQDSVCNPQDPTVGMHFFNSKTRSSKINSASLLARVMKWRCPLSFERLKVEGQVE